MDLQALNRRLGEQLVAFAWDQWGQMGILASRQGRSPWAQDPEALIVFTLEIARGEPRLFDELLDWMLLNEPLLSVRRLRAMCIDDTDRALVEGTLGWLAGQRPRARLTGRRTGEVSPIIEPLFRPAGPLTHFSPSFAAAGLARPPVDPSHKSRAPEETEPINLAFRLRQILGVGIRAEVVRILLGIGAPRVTAQVLARGSGYSKRNVHDALAGLAAAGVVSAVTVGGESSAMTPTARRGRRYCAYTQRRSPSTETGARCSRRCARSCASPQSPSSRICPSTWSGAVPETCWRRSARSSRTPAYRSASLRRPRASATISKRSSSDCSQHSLQPRRIRWSACDAGRGLRGRLCGGEHGVPCAPPARP